MLESGVSQGRQDSKKAGSMKFTVYGQPIPQGSMRAFMPKRGKFPIVTADNAKTKPWRQEIAGVAHAENAEAYLAPSRTGIPFRVAIDFFFDRPVSLKKSIVDKVTKPDLDKLARSVLDALTGICFHDDSQVVDLHVTKNFGSPARAEITVEEALPPQVEIQRQPIKDSQLPF
jgi:crossover junction endodeoxyribonuclease RusA